MRAATARKDMGGDDQVVPHAEREFDLIVWGATSITGSRMCALLAESGGALKWAVAGRRAGALEALLPRFKGAACPPVHPSWHVPSGGNCAEIPTVAVATRWILASIDGISSPSLPILELCTSMELSVVSSSSVLLPAARHSASPP